MIRRYLLGLVLLACSEPAATGEPEFKHIDWCDYNRCEVAGVRVFTPEPDIAAITKKDAARWAAATGLDLSIGDDGIPVRFEAGVWKEDLNHPGEWLPLCGATYFTWGPEGQTVVNSIVVNSDALEGCPYAEAILLHEMGHSIDGNTFHVNRGVMKIDASDNGLDDDALSLICSYAPCTKFAPERYLRAVQ